MKLLMVKWVGVWKRKMVGAKSNEMGIGFNGIGPFFSDEKLCCFGSEVLHVLFFF